MRILLTSQGYPPTVSGVTLVVQKLARALAERGHHVTVLAGSDTRAPYSVLDGAVRVVRLHSRKNPYWPANPVPRISAKHLAAFIAHEQPDIIHAHDALPLALPLLRARGRIEAPIVATCHYFPSFVAAYLSRSERVQAAIEAIAWRYTISLYRRMDEVVFATATHRDEFEQRGLGVRTRVISNGIDLDRYVPGLPPLDVVGDMPVPPHPRVLAAGRLARDKNLGVLIRALAEDGARQAHLLIVGEGPERQLLEQTAQAAGVTDRVHFLGFVPEEAMPRLFCSCDAFAISSHFEVQSLPALQAAAAGLPIVAAPYGALPEVCRDGENGVLAKDGSPTAFGAGIARVLQPREAERMSRASMALSRQHDERWTFDSYVSLYEGVIHARLERQPAEEPVSASGGRAPAPIPGSPMR